MFDTGNLLLWVVVLLVLAAAFLGLRRHFSADAREARRRTRSHAPVVTTKRGPSIKLAVNLTEREKRPKG